MARKQQQTLIESADAWQRSAVGGFILALAEFVIAYILGSFAIDTGSWMLYFFTVIFVAGGIRHIVYAVKSLTHGSK